MSLSWRDLALLVTSARRVGTDYGASQVGHR